MPVAADALRDALPDDVLGLSRAQTNVPDDQDDAIASAMGMYVGGEGEATAKGPRRAMLVVTDAPGQAEALLGRIADDGFTATSAYEQPGVAFYAMHDGRGAGLAAVVRQRLIVLLTAEGDAAVDALYGPFEEGLLDRFVPLLVEDDAP
jgi:hypothetical protein